MRQQGQQACVTRQSHQGVQVVALQRPPAVARSLDNTLFVVLSDNGADPYRLASPRLDKVFWFWYPFNYSVDYETLGQKGSFSAYGQDWAQESNTPLHLFKGNAHEGGIRRPMFVSWPARFGGGRISDRFTHVKDVVPTLLEVAGAAAPNGSYQGREVLRLDGTSMLALPGRQGAAGAWAGRSDRLRTRRELVARQGRLQAGEDLAPFGDNTWHLYDIRHDPTETQVRKEQQPELFKAMQYDMQRYLVDNGVVPLPDDYLPMRALVKNNAGLLLKMLWPYLLTVMVALGLLGWGAWRFIRRLRRSNAVRRSALSASALPCGVSLLATEPASPKPPIG